jgi:hypothetical protein
MALSTRASASMASMLPAYILYFQKMWSEGFYQLCLYRLFYRIIVRFSHLCTIIFSQNALIRRSHEIKYKKICPTQTCIHLPEPYSLGV